MKVLHEGDFAGKNMAYLPLANILHHKLRSVLSSLGIGVGICMLITLSGLSRGSIGEIADRWEHVNANLIVYPKNWGNNIANLAGAFVPDKIADQFRARKELVQNVVPVMMYRVKIAGQDNMATGVDPQDWPLLTGERSKLVKGELFDKENRCSDWLVKKLATGGLTETERAKPLNDQTLAELGGMEIVIDQRLAEKAHLDIGQTVTMENHQWKIVGIAQTGVMSRVFLPRRVAQRFFGGLCLTQSTVQFVKLAPGADENAAVGDLQNDYADLMPLRQYRGRLEETFGVMNKYIDIVNGISLVIAFLFIMVTLYMMVLQRTRDIAILKSCGAGRWFIVRQMLGESALLTMAGTLLGIGLSFPAAWLIRVLTLYTVELNPKWILIAIGAAAAGALASAVYPAWRATRVDMVEALTYE